MYLDSCTIVKLLTPEGDSEFYQAHLFGQALSSSELAWTEVKSALLMKERQGRLTSAERELAWDTFEHLVATEELHLRKLNFVTLKKANSVLGSAHPEVALRTLDSIHVAACDLSQDFPLCTTDLRMRAAARVLGIPLFPEELS
jgi:predicted nucleic acid-binding protein